MERLLYSPVYEDTSLKYEFKTILSDCLTDITEIFIFTHWKKTDLSKNYP